MKFITNNSEEDNHLHAIISALKGAVSLDIAVAFISPSAVNSIREYFVDQNGHAKATRVLTTTDLGTTSPDSVAALLQLGAEVKILNLDNKIFHPKLWIFRNPTEGDSCLVGSANLTHRGLAKNIECGIFIDNNNKIIADCKKSYSKWWNDKNCVEVDNNYIEMWKKDINDDLIIKRQARKAIARQKEPDALNLKILRDFIDRRLDVNKPWKLARGWYIIPDQGNIDDAKLNDLWEICNLIYQSSNRIEGYAVTMDEAIDDNFSRILRITKRRLQRPEHVTSIRDQFIRAEKNYLEKFNFIYIEKQGNVKNMLLTAPGVMFAQASGIEEMRSIYTEMIAEIQWHGVQMHKLLTDLIIALGKISYSEFEYFVSHFNATDTFDTCCEIIRAYRLLDEQGKSVLKDHVDARLLAIERERGTKVVVGNYRKKQRTTMSVFAACNNIKLSQIDNEYCLQKR